MVSIRVWEYNNNKWAEIFTSGELETKDECNYFRVIRNDKKEFYYNVRDYMTHMNLNEIITIFNVKYTK
jgi:hypothetical protein